jgi:beta-1,4-N-acetylglucosaminyltransferase
MMTLLGSLDFERYTPRRYIYCHGDTMSLDAVQALERSKVDRDKGFGSTRSKSDASTFSLLALPRARRVGQPLFSTLLSTLHTALHALYRLFLLPLLNNPRHPFVDVLVINGPGTVVVLVAISWIRRVSLSITLSLPVQTTQLSGPY